MILEGIVTTKNADGTPNIAPMGPMVDRAITTLQLRPFRTSRTFENLMRTGEGVLHVTDDVELFARAAVHQWTALPDVRPCPVVDGWILAGACRWYAFRVTHWDDAEDRCRADCEVVGHASLRDFFGFNRAKHAVLEVAILATRIGILPDAFVRDELQRLASPVEKTAGDQEIRAFHLLRDSILSRLATGVVRAPS